MDIITHTLSGVAVATVVINVKSFSFKQSSIILGVATLGGCLPDIDVISLWSGFDASIGQWFSLQPGRHIYSAKYWYSHHAFFHSLLASVLFTVLVGLVAFGKQLVKQGFSRPTSFQVSLMLVFFMAYNIHLLEDMLTPSSTWGGVAYLWPNPVYIGGWGKIWWWNNYDVFGIVVLVIGLNLLVKLILKRRSVAGYTSLVVFFMGFSLSTYLVNSRNISYNYSRSGEFRNLEQQSLKEQKDLLGDRIYHVMLRIDRMIPVSF